MGDCIVRLLKVLAGVALACCVSARAGGPAVGEVPPDAVGTAGLGDEIHLKDYQGKVVLLSYFASWCGPCRQELPTLERALGKDRLQVIAVDWQETYGEFRILRQHFDDHQFNLMLAWDADGEYGKRFGVHAIPHMLVIDRQGKVAYIHNGYGDDSMDRLIDELNTLLNPAGS